MILCNIEEDEVFEHEFTGSQGGNSVSMLVWIEDGSVAMVNGCCYFFPRDRCCEKNSCSNALHSSCSTPPSTTQR